MAQLTQADWFDEGFKILEETGAAELTIENLTRRLKRTKGSFYHHFKNRDNYSEKLLEFWEERQTLDIINISGREKTFQDINQTLLKLSMEKASPKIEVAIRAWALRDPLARSFQERIDQKRMDFLRSMFSLMTNNPDQVEMISLIRYCFYIGSQQIIPAVGKDDYKTRLDELTAMFETYLNHRNKK